MPIGFWLNEKSVFRMCSKVPAETFNTRANLKHFCIIITHFNCKNYLSCVKEIVINAIDEKKHLSYLLEKKAPRALITNFLLKQSGACRLEVNSAFVSRRYVNFIEGQEILGNSRLKQ